MKKRVVALGFFDGVHKGHGELLKMTKKRAEELSVSPCVLTYSNHPSEVLKKEPVKLINTVDERKVLISELYGICDIVTREFTEQYANISCEEFFSRVLLREIGAVHVVAGYDFRFGHRGAGDVETLVKLCGEAGCGCDVVERVCVDGKTVSSSVVRELIASGRVDEAARFLGHRHSLISKIEHGQQLGGKINFPTINQLIPERVQVPKLGVYSSRTFVGEKAYKSVTDIGVRPTVCNTGEIRAETNILDFSGELYGACVRVELCSFLRDEIKFDSVSELRCQIARDVETVRNEKF